MRGWNGPGLARQVTRRGQENCCPGGAGRGHLLLDPADRDNRPVDLDLAGACDELAPGQVRGSQLVDDREGEHQPGARTTDVADVDLHLKRELERLDDLYSDHGLSLVAGRPEI